MFAIMWPWRKYELALDNRVRWMNTSASVEEFLAAMPLIRDKRDKYLISLRVYLETIGRDEGMALVRKPKPPLP